MKKNSSILNSKISLFFILSLKKARQSVYSSVCLTLTIIFSKMVIIQLPGPENSLKTRAFCIPETMEVVVINEHKNFVLVTFLVMWPCFPGLNNSQKLIIVGFVLSFSWDHFSWEVSYQVLLARVVRRLWTKNPNNSLTWYVSPNLDITFGVEVLEDRT